MPTGAPWVRETLPARSLEGEGLEGRGTGQRWNRLRGQAVPEAWSSGKRWMLVPRGWSRCGSIPPFPANGLHTPGLVSKATSFSWLECCSTEV